MISDDMLKVEKEALPENLRQAIATQNNAYADFVRRDVEQVILLQQVHKEFGISIHANSPDWQLRECLSNVLADVPERIYKVLGALPRLTPGKQWVFQADSFLVGHPVPPSHAVYFATAYPLYIPFDASANQMHLLLAPQIQKKKVVETTTFDTKKVVK